MKVVLEIPNRATRVGLTMPEVPRVGESVQYDGVWFQVSKVLWTPENRDQDAVIVSA